MALHLPRRVVRPGGTAGASSALPYPLQNEITRELRYEAARAGRDDLLAFYGGQSAPLASLRSAADLVASLAAETGAAFERFL